MGRPRECSCHCEQEPDCFGCFNLPEISDMNVDIGPITGGGPEFASGTVEIRNYQGGTNCHLWGVNPAGFPYPDCGLLGSAGGSAWQYHTILADVFAGNQLLQKHPYLCLWRKRSLKLLQGVYHRHGNLFTAGPPPEISAQIVNTHNTHVTFPYADPVDPGDQWSRVVWPANDRLCNTVVDGRFPSIKWLCYNANCVSTLTLKLSNLRLLTDNNTTPANKCLIGQTIYDPSGPLHWELEYVVIRAATATNNMYTTGLSPPGSLDGVVSGGHSLYGATGGPIDSRDPTTGFTSIPPYSKITVDSWCNNIGSLYSGYGVACLRWTKPVDCNADFNNEPIDLKLDAPRAFITYCHPGCLDYHTNAAFIGVTGYNETATVVPVYV